MKRCLAILLVVLTLALSMDFTALADTSSSQKLMENGQKWLAADALTAGGDTANLLTKLFNWAATTAAKDFGNKIISYGVNTVFDMIFGSDGPEQEIIQQLDVVLKEMNHMEDQIAQLNGKVVEASLLQTINEFVRWTWDGSASMSLGYAALRAVDDDLKAGKLTKEQAEQHRKSLLLYGVTGHTEGTVSGATCNFDDMTLKYGKFLVTNQQMITGGTGNLFTFHRESMRYAVHWENQAYDAMEDFQLYALSGFIAAATVDRLSLLARIEQIQAWNKANPQKIISEYLLNETLKELDSYIKAMDTLKAQKVTRRADSERYYWTPGHEMLLTVAKQKIPPQERKNKGVCNIDRNTPNKGVLGLVEKYHSNTQSWRIEPYFPFWKQFIRYDEGNMLTISYDQLNTIYRDYAGQKTLYDIFFSDKEANMPKISGANANWCFVVDADSSHPLTYGVHQFKADQVYVYGVRNKKPSAALDAAERIILCYYHSFKSDTQKGTDYISIGVKKVPENDAIEPENIHVDNGETEKPIKWRKGSGDLKVPFDSVSNVKRFAAQIDGVDVPDVWLSVQDGEDGSYLIIDKAAMKLLPKGEHQLKAGFECVDGDGETVKIVCERSFTVADALPKTGDTFPLSGVLAMMGAAAIGMLWLLTSRCRSRSRG